MTRFHQSQTAVVCSDLPSTNVSLHYCERRWSRKKRENNYEQLLLGFNSTH